MVFADLFFLFAFLPAFAICYLFASLAKGVAVKNLVLVVFSLIFYAWGEPIYVFLLLLCALLNWLFGKGIDQKGRGRTFWLVAGLVCNLAILGTFKYLGFFADLLGRFGLSVQVPEIALPIGISFYTFQSISYLLDVYRKESKAQRRFGDLLLYISMFPQLIAGPIVRYGTIAKEINNRHTTAADFADGSFRFLVGLGKKVILANQLSEVSDQFLAGGLAGLSTAGAWVGLLAFTLQIYFDFSGYSDMAIGLGQMFGFHFLENFNYPYISGSIREFWRRWHISLSTWFRDYLYIPLGGNRKGRGRTIFNKYVVFFCTGFWHGANWTFLVWGLFHGSLEMLEEKHWIPVHKEWKVFNHIYTLLMVTVGFVIFRADTIKQGWDMILAMFGLGPQGSAGWVRTRAMLSPYVLLIIVCSIIGATPLLKNLVGRVKNTKHGEALCEYGSMLVSLIILGLCMMALASQSYNPFIYFRF